MMQYRTGFRQQVTVKNQQIQGNKYDKYVALLRQLAILENDWHQCTNYKSALLKWVAQIHLIIVAPLNRVVSGLI
jgi:hypothetical protein